MYVRCVSSQFVLTVWQVVLTGVLVIPGIPIPFAVTDQLDELARHDHRLSPFFEDEQIYNIVPQAGVSGRRGC